MFSADKKRTPMGRGAGAGVMKIPIEVGDSNSHAFKIFAAISIGNEMKAGTKIKIARKSCLSFAQS